MKYYKNLLNDIFQYRNVYNSIYKILAEIDVYHSVAKNSIIYKYVKPIISTTGEPVITQPSNINIAPPLTTNPTSFLKIKQMRHPLIERMKNLKTFYIAHDLELSGNGII